MDPIRFSIDRPIAVIAAVLMAVLFGALALTRIPIQLIPDVRKPVIEIETITHRRNPIYQALLPGLAEHKLLMGLPREPTIYAAVNKGFDLICDIFQDLSIHIEFFLDQLSPRFTHICS